MEILGFIPARGGSKRIPKKNIYPLNGKPLIAYTIEAAKISSINRILLSSDSQEIADIAVEYGLEVPFLRPTELARDDSIIEDAIIDTLRRLKKSEGYEPEVIVLLHPTTPLRTTDHINESIDLLMNKGADSVVSVSEPMEHPGDMVYWVKNGKIRFLLEDLIESGKTQRQGYPECFFLNGVIYTFTVLSLMKSGSRFGEKTVPYLMKQIDSIDIDSLDDMLLAELLLKRKHELEHGS